MLYKDFLDYVTENSGAVGSACELALRSYSAGRIVTNVKPCGKFDAIVTFKAENGKRHKVTVEIKTACGRIDHCSNSQYIAYWAEPSDDMEVENGFVVFSREQWLDFINGYTGRGKLTVVRNGETHIQSFRGIMTGVRPKASLPIANYIYDVCDAMPTFAEWLENLRG